MTAWSFKIKVVTKVGDKVRVVVTTYADGKEFAGREMSFVWDKVKDLTKLQLRDKIKNQVAYITQQDNDEYLLKSKIDEYINMDIGV